MRGGEGDYNYKAFKYLASPYIIKKLDGGGLARTSGLRAVEREF